MWGYRPVVLNEKKECIAPCPVCGSLGLMSNRMANFFPESCENCHLEYVVDGYKYYYVKNIGFYPWKEGRLKISPDGEKEWI